MQESTYHVPTMRQEPVEVPFSAPEITPTNEAIVRKLAKITAQITEVRQDELGDVAA